MTIKSKLATLIILLSFAFTSCKYEEGPFISLRTKKARLVGNWKLGEWYINDIFREKSTYNEQLILKDDGTGVFSSMTISDNGDTLNLTASVNWDFIDSKEKVELNLNFGNNSFKNEIEWKILKLKHKELWLTTDEVTGENWEKHWIPE